MHYLGQTTGSPAVVTGVQKISSPDELQVQAMVVAVYITEWVIIHGRNWLGKRSGLVFKQSQENTRADAEIDRHGIHDPVRGVADTRKVFGVILSQPGFPEKNDGVSKPFAEGPSTN